MWPDVINHQVKNKYVINRDHDPETKVNIGKWSFFTLQTIKWKQLFNSTAIFTVDPPADSETVQTRDSNISTKNRLHVYFIINDKRKSKGQEDWTSQNSYCK